MKSSQDTQSRDVVSWILVLSLGFSAVDLTFAAVSNAMSQGISALSWFLVAFGAAFVPLAYLSWLRKKNGFLAAAIVALVFNLFNLGDPTFPYLFTNPAHPSFSPVLSIIISCSLVIIYGAYGFYKLRRAETLPIHITRASIPAMIALGFAIGGLLVCALAAGTQTRLLAAAGTARDVTIVSGADNPMNSRFYDPDPLTMAVGKTVVWFNGDPVAHTVTSTVGAFDSGNMNSGDTYRHAFTQVGNFAYHCLYHTWMTGTIVVE